MLRNPRQLINQLRAAYFMPAIPTECSSHQPSLNYGGIPRNLMPICRTFQPQPDCSTYRITLPLVPFAPCASVGGWSYQHLNFQQNFGAGDSSFNHCTGLCTYNHNIYFMNMPEFTNGKFFVANHLHYERASSISDLFHANDYTAKFTYRIFI